MEPLALVWHIDHPPEKRDADAEAARSQNSAGDISEDSDESDDEIEEEQASQNEPDVGTVCQRTKRGRKAKEKPSRPGDDVRGFQPTPNDPSRLLKLTDEGPCLPLVPSSKMVAILETVTRWQTEAPSDKILSMCLSHSISHHSC